MKINPGDKVGDYIVLKEITAGGMGQIFRVQNCISKRIDAMKVLLPDLPKEAKADERFTREIEVLAKLDHPNITTLRTAGRIDDLIIMIMEYVDGVTLEKRMEDGPLPLEEGLDYIGQTALALAYAHERGVVHRDIKPANIMITPEGKVKLMDFGIAKVVGDHSLTMTGVAIGSLHYMSPEQIQNSSAVFDPRSDIYSLGIVLYEATTGQKPYDAETQYGILDAHLHANPTPPIALRPDLPPALNAAILKAMARDPSERYNSAKEFWDAIQAARPQGAEQAKRSRERSGVDGHDLPSAATPETRGTRSPAVYKWLVPLLVGAALIGSLVLVLSHSHRQQTRLPISPPPTSATFLTMASGDMVYVSGGEALLGPSLKRVTVGSFYIDKTEVTNRAFLDFCHATGLTPPKGIELVPGDNPVVNVTVEEARAFCRWAGKRLPTADEWEKAARGSNGQPYPWGSAFDYSLANLPRDAAAARTARLASAMAYESGKSPYGALNMLGNAWEWVDAAAPAPPAQEFRAYQQIFRDLVPPLSASEPYYYARGGSYKFVDPNPAELISDPGSPLPARARKPDVGFRCARDVKN